jgi:phosphoglycerate kinase
MLPLPALEDLGDVSGRRVLVRLDLNTPLTDGPDGLPVVADDFRIRAALPTLEWLTEHGAVVTVATHLGRPENDYDERYVIDPVRTRLAELVSGVEVMENLRFSPGEKRNDPDFVASLIKDQELFVNDAFGVSHREHASIVGPPQFLPSAAGRLIEKEVAELETLMHHPARPFVVVIGGAKVGDKLGLLRSLVQKADRVLVGGGMAFTFLQALGHPVGNSILDRERIDPCRALLAESSKVMLPVDVRAGAPGLELHLGGGDGGPADAAAAAASVAAGQVKTFGQNLPDGWRGLDIGPATAELFREAIVGAGSIMWNGPMGVFEDPRFEAGTRTIAGAVADSDGRSVVGGGDSVAALNHFGLASKVDHISTGGGASLELLEHGDLPGLAALRASVPTATSSAR